MWSRNSCLPSSSTVVFRALGYKVIAYPKSVQVKSAHASSESLTSKTKIMFSVFSDLSESQIGEKSVRKASTFMSKFFSFSLFRYTVYFNLLMPGDNEKVTHTYCSFQLQVCLSMCDIFVTTRH